MTLLHSCQIAPRFTLNNSNPISKSKVTSNKKSENNALSIGQFSGMVYRGKASFYADKFEGRLTASGEPFRQSSFTAAHRELPFNTILLVTNLKNGKRVKVRVSDRGPYVNDRIIDLSKAAANEIDMIYDGIAEVEIEVLGDYEN